MSEATRIADVLGGRKVLGRDIKNMNDLMDITRHGLSVKVIYALQERTGVPRGMFVDSITLSARTFSRRMAERILKPDESDRAVRIARVVARAEDALGSLEKARLWLSRPNRAINMVAPITLLDTDTGAQRVTDILGRIEHGTFS